MFNMQPRICASILNVEPDSRIPILKQLANLGVTHVHIDVMDGIFVPNTAISLAEINAICQTGIVSTIDVHLMVSRPSEYIARIDPRVDYVTIHYESVTPDLLPDVIKQVMIKFRVGLAIKPDTPIAAITPLLSMVDLVLVMSVEPGWGGQKFIPIALEKIAELADIRRTHGLDYVIQVDGGIDNTTAPSALESGADWLVCGTYLVRNLNKDVITSLLDGNKNQ